MIVGGLLWHFLEPTGPKASACTEEGTRTNDRAQTWATISTVSLVAGGVMLAGGAFLFFTASPARSSASIGLTKTF